ncbi:hypothetical protein ACSGFO_00225 [Mesorhizobium sp. WSM4083]|uniref:hypothetical protein n=1 Tax=Mesorhizobium sp. WSM4083 TaxID=3446363 RepID=UPI003F4FF392
MTGNFLSAASCFWQPVSRRAAVQAKSTEAIGQENRQGVLTDGRETDDVAFLLMDSPSPVGGSRGPRDLADIWRIVDPREKETGLVRVSGNWLSAGIHLSQAQSPAGGADLRKT